HARFRECRAECLDVLRYLVLSDVTDGPGADGALTGAGQEVEIFIEIGELDPLAGLERHEGRLTRLQLAGRQSAQPPAVIQDTSEAQLAQLTIADNIDSRVRLAAYDVDHA